MIFSDNLKLREFFASRPALQDMWRVLSRLEKMIMLETYTYIRKGGVLKKEKMKVKHNFLFLLFLS